MESATQTEPVEPTAPEAEADTGNGSAPKPETFEVLRPVDGSVIQTVPIDSPESVAETVARVRANQPAWEAIGFAGRRRWLESLRDWILANQDSIDDLMQQETGKVRADATLEAFYCLEAINFWSSEGAESSSPTRPSRRTTRC